MTFFLEIVSYKKFFEKGAQKGAGEETWPGPKGSGILIAS